MQLNELSVGPGTEVNKVIYYAERKGRVSRRKSLVQNNLSATPGATDWFSIVNHAYQRDHLHSTTGRVTIVNHLYGRNDDLPTTGGATGPVSIIKCLCRTGYKRHTRPCQHRQTVCMHKITYPLQGSRHAGSAQSTVMIHGITSGLQQTELGYLILCIHGITDTFFIHLNRDCHGRGPHEKPRKY